MEKAKLLTLRITERCNLACRYCYAARAEQGDMPFGIAALAIDRFAGPGRKLKIQFTGGEPLLCLDLMEQAAAYARQQGIAASFSVQTNGTLLSEAACRALKAMNCAVGVSLRWHGRGERAARLPGRQARLSGRRSPASSGLARRACAATSTPS